MELSLCVSGEGTNNWVIWLEAIISINYVYSEVINLAFDMGRFKSHRLTISFSGSDNKSRKVFWVIERD